MLTAHVPRITNHAQIEIADTFAPVVRTESEQDGLDFIGHVAREFKRIAFAATEDAAFTENSGGNVQYSQYPDLRARGRAGIEPGGVGD